MSALLEEQPARLSTVTVRPPWWLAPEFVELVELRTKLLAHPTDAGAEASARLALGWSLFELELLLRTFGAESETKRELRLGLRIQAEGSACVAFTLEWLTSTRPSEVALSIRVPAPPCERPSPLRPEILALAEFRARIVRGMPVESGRDAERSARKAFAQMLLASEEFVERFALRLERCEEAPPRVRRFDRERSTTRVAWSLRILEPEERSGDGPRHL
jgi:hypothetical protein